MSVENATKFFATLGQDPALVKRLSEGANALDTFLARAVAEAKQRGYEFSAGEAHHFLLERTRAAGKNYELSEKQLELVAGGHSSAVTYDLIAQLLSDLTFGGITMGHGMDPNINLNAPGLFKP